MSLKLRRSLITILSACVLLFASVAIFVAPNGPVKVNAAVIEAQIEGVEDNYILNAKEKFPVSISTPIPAGEGIVIYPDGKYYKIDANKEYTLNLSGQYILRYYAEDKVVEKTFMVNQKNFVLSAEETAGKNEIVAATKESMKGLQLPNGVNYPNKSDWPNIEQNLTTFGEEALIVRMESGTKFTYSTPIDLTKAGADGLTNIVKFQPFHSDNDKSKGTSIHYITEMIAREVVVTLTDCYDSSRYVKFTIDNGSNYPYSRAGTDNLLDAGWVFPASKKADTGLNTREFYEGTQYGYAYIGQYGNRPAGYDYEVPKRDGVYLKFDYENAQVWTTSYAKGGVSDYQQTMTADFKHKDVYPSQAYRGFTTGEAYLSIEFSNYQTDGVARVDIYEIAGIKAADLINMKKTDDAGDFENFFKDTKSPVVDVNLNTTLNDGIFVDVGTDFEIPSANYYDVNLKTQKVTAYRNYYDVANRTNVPIINNKVSINDADIYYLVYSAEDSYGNTGEKVIKLYGVDDDNNPAIEFSYGEKFTTINAGEKYLLPKVTFNTKNNASDRKLKITFKSDKENVLIADLNNGQEIDEFLSKDTEFFLSYSGDYTVEYDYSDNAVSNVVSYKVKSVASNAINIPYEPTLPRYLIKNATYDFDEIIAYSYSTGSAKPYKPADVYIAYDQDIDEKNIANSVFTKLKSSYSNKITGSEKAVLKYVYESTVMYTDIAKIVDTNISTPTKLQQYKYFVGDFATAFKGSYSEKNGQPKWENPDPSYDETLFPQDVYNKVVEGRSTFDSSKLDYKSKVLTGNNKLEFINVIDISNFSLFYRILDDADARLDSDNFNALKLVFTDPYDASKQVYVKLYKLDDTVFLDVNGQKTTRVNQAFSGSIDKSIAYNRSTGLFNVSGVTEKIPFVFDFTTTRAYFDIVFEDISGVAGIRIMELNGHKFVHDGNARTLPISLMTIPQGNYKAGSVVTIYPAEFIDVLSPIIKANVSLKVTDPSNNPVTALDGTVLDGKCDPYKEYQIKIVENGQYKVSYSATSGIKQRSNPPGFIFVTDLVAPEITFEGDIYEGCVLYLKPGQKYEVKYSVADDVSLPENLFTRIIWSNKKHASTSFFHDNIISFVKEGEYEVGVSTADELGNFARKTFTVIVTKEEVK